MENVSPRKGGMDGRTRLLFQGKTTGRRRRRLQSALRSASFADEGLYRLSSHVGMQNEDGTFSRKRRLLGSHLSQFSGGAWRLRLGLLLLARFGVDAAAIVGFVWSSALASGALVREHWQSC